MIGTSVFDNWIRTLYTFLLGHMMQRGFDTGLETEFQCNCDCGK